MGVFALNDIASAAKQLAERSADAEVRQLADWISKLAASISEAKDAAAQALVAARKA